MIRTTRRQVPEANTGYFAFPFNVTNSSLIVSKIPTTINERPLPAGDWELVRSCNEQDCERDALKVHALSS